MNFPADQITLGKMYLHMKERLNEDEYKEIYEKLGPFPVFKITAVFLSGVNRDEEEKKANFFLKGLPEVEREFENINEALNSYTRVKNRFSDFISYQGYLDMSLMASFDKKGYSSFLNDKVNFMSSYNKKK